MREIFAFVAIDFSFLIPPASTLESVVWRFSIIDVVNTLSNIIIKIYVLTGAFEMNIKQTSS